MCVRLGLSPKYEPVRDFTSVKDTKTGKTGKRKKRRKVSNLLPIRPTRTNHNRTRHGPHRRTIKPRKIRIKKKQQVKITKQPRTTKKQKNKKQRKVKIMKKKFKLQDLDCANCAAKMEDGIKKINGVKDASVSFMTQKMTIEAEEEEFERIMQEVVKVCAKVEPDCKIIL